MDSGDFTQKEYKEYQLWKSLRTQSNPYSSKDDAERTSNKNKNNRIACEEVMEKPLTSLAGNHMLDIEEMTQELGKPPNMVNFVIDTHTSKKLKTIIDKKAPQIAESLKSKMDMMLSKEMQDGSLHSNPLSQVQVDALFLEEIKGNRFEIRNLSIGKSSSSALDTSIHVELLNAKAKIAEIEKAQEEQAKKFDDLKAMCMKHIQNSSGEFNHLSEDDN